MSNSISLLEADLQELKTLRRRLVRELDDVDTKIIGLRLKLEAAKEKERYDIDQERSMERSTLFDED